MNYKEACAEVLCTYKNAQVRSKFISFIERYSQPLRPVTSWHTTQKDMEVIRFFLTKLGLVEGSETDNKDYIVISSSLDPDSVRFSWSASGAQTMVNLFCELERWKSYNTQRAIAQSPSNDKEILATIPDAVSDANTPAAGNDSATAEPSVADQIVSRTVDIAEFLSSKIQTETTDLDISWARWADRVVCLMHSEDAKSSEIPPFAPLCALEEYARLNGMDNMPEFAVFDSDAFNSPGWWLNYQAGRMIDNCEHVGITNAINALPLAEQIIDETDPYPYSLTPLYSYLAFTRKELLLFPKDKSVLWMVMNSEIAANIDALRFALSAENMRRYVERLVEFGYPGFGCVLTCDTTLSIHNQQAIHTQGEILPRADYSNMLNDRAMYKTNFLVFRQSEYYKQESIVSPGMKWNCKITLPYVSPDSNSPKTDEMYIGVRRNELATEWFDMVHGTNLADPATSPFAYSWSSTDTQLSARTTHTDIFHRNAEDLATSSELTLDHCSPQYAPLNGIENPDGELTFTQAGAFLNGVTAMIRKKAKDYNITLKFKEDSPYHPSKFVAGIWSGLSSDLAPESLSLAKEQDVFPCMPKLPTPAYMSEFCKFIRENPLVQHKFAKRTKDAHRRHVIIIETNLLADSVLTYRYTDGANSIYTDLVSSIKALFTSTFLNGGANPFVWKMEDVTLNGHLYEAHTWISHECPDYLKYVPVGSTPYIPLTPAIEVVLCSDEETGRLHIILSTTQNDVAIRAKLMHRYENMMLVASAMYRAARTKDDKNTRNLQAGFVSVDENMSEKEKYRKALKVLAASPSFGLCPTGFISPTEGKPGLMWSETLRLCGLGEDVIPSRTWYLSYETSKPLVKSYLFRK